MSMANLQISFSLFLFFTNLTYLHIVNSHIGISIYKRNPVPIIAKIKKSLNSMLKIELSKEHSNRQKLQSWLKKYLYFLNVQHNIFSALPTSSENVFKTFSRRLQNVLIKTNIFILLIRLQKTSSRRFQDVLPRRLQNVLKTSCENVFQTSSKHLPKTFQDVFRMSSRSLAKTS